MICDSWAVLFRLLRNSVYSLHMFRFRCFDVLESIYNSWNSFAQSLFPLPTPRGLALLESERILYISDAGNNQIRRLDLETGDLSSPAPEAFFSKPSWLSIQRSQQVSVCFRFRHSCRVSFEPHRRLSNACGGSWTSSSSWRSLEMVLYSSVRV